MNKLQIILPALLLLLSMSIMGCRKLEEDPKCFHPDWVCHTCACTEEYAPVCGCNNVTYSNECHARVQGYEVKHAGECGK